MKTGARPELSQFERGRIIGLLECGLSKAEVARRVRHSRCAVRYAWNKWKAENACDNLPRPGRPRLTNDRDERMLVKCVRNNRFVPYRILAANFAVKVSRVTFNRRALQFGYNSRRPLIRIPLSPSHRQSRLKWCKERINESQAYWNTIMFSDESRFNLDFHDGRVRVHRKISDRFNEECIAQHDRYGGGSVMVWGAIGYGFRSRLLFIDGNLNAVRYVTEILNVEVFTLLHTKPNIIFMHDNARSHTAFVSRNALKEAGIVMLPWPARSPDLNPIEHVWDILGRRVSSSYDHPPATLHQLRQRLSEQWNKLSDEECNNLIESMTTRIKECVSKNGGHTHY